MNDNRKTKKELIEELKSLRQVVSKSERYNQKQPKKLESFSNKKHNKNEHRHKQIFETNQAIKLVIDPKDGSIVQANQAAVDFYGYSLEELTNKKITDINILPARKVLAELKKAIAEKGLFYNHKHRLASGEIRDVEVYSGPLKEGNKTYLYSITHNVTRKKQVEKIQKVLLNISKATGETSSLQDLLRVIHEQVGTLIESKNFFVALYNTENNEYSFPYYVDEFDSGMDFTQDEMKGSLTEYVRKRKTPLLINDRAHKKMMEEGEIGLVGQSSHIWMGVPFEIDEQFSGVIVLQSYSDVASYTKRDLELMTFVSEHISWAIERKKAQQKLKESEDRYRSLVDNSPLSIAIHAQGKLVFVNKTGIRIFGGKNESDFLGKPISQFVHPDYKNIVKQRVRKLEDKQEVPTLEEKFRRLDGKIIDVEVMGAPLTFKGIDAVQVVVTEISERKKAEQALRESEESYRGIFDNATDAIYIQDSSGHFLDVNKTVEKMYGYDHDYFIGKTPEFLSAPDKNDLLKVGKHIKEANKGKPQCFEFWGLRKNGEVFLKEVRLNEVVYFGQKAIIAVAQDITERKESEKQLKRSEQRFRTLIENSPIAISMSRNEKIILVNNAYLELFGYTDKQELIGAEFNEQLAISERKKILKQNKNREKSKEISNSYETIGLRKDGSTFPFQANVSVINLAKGPATLAYISNISDIKKAEEERLNLERQILHTQKLESLGVLAGGIAHDFNNLLTGILGNTGLAMMHSEGNSPVRTNLFKIEDIASRAAELCNQMLAYSGKGKFVIQPIDLNEIIHEMALLLNVSIPKKVILETSLESKIPATEADVTQVRQIIMNLITNAADAIGTKTGVITVKSYSKYLSGVELKSNYIENDPEEGDYTILEVSDSGCGMKEETLNKLFDPFYTTKFTGRGLGLAAVLGIVRGHKGTLMIDSTYGVGTTVKIALPASNKKALPLVIDKGTDKNLQGEGKILVVDDEESVRSILKEALEFSGYKTILAEDGEKAIKLYKKHREDIRLIILDLTMPKLNGEETYKRLIKLDPHVKVILSSGFNAQDTISDFASKGVAGYLQKPYHLQSLSDKINEVLA